MQKKYVVRLTDAEREALSVLSKKKHVSSQKVRRARVLLKADADGPDGPTRKLPRRSAAAPRPWRTSGNGSSRRDLN